MKKFLAATAIASAVALGGAVAIAAPASAGNNSSNFYLTGGCNPNVGAPTLGVNMKFTNYDNGANQTYHVSWTRSGVAYSVLGIYIDGVYKGKGSDMFINVSGHGPHFVGIKTSILGTNQSCSVWK